MNTNTPRQSMLAEERQREILARVMDAGAVRVATLAKELAVTPETIRRDLEKLGADGKLLRTHGGAVPIEDDRRDPPLDIRQGVQSAEKRSIARAAARHVQEGDVIALDASSTARELARVLPDLPLTVVTNSLSAAMALVDRTRVRVICSGGILDAPSLSLVGSAAAQTLARFHVRTLFLSCQGVDAARGLSVTGDEHAAVKRTMIDLADRVIVLADATKLGIRGVEFFCEPGEIDLLITDAKADPGFVDALRKAGVAVELAT